MDGKDNIVSWLGNGLSAGAIFTTFVGWTPAIAAFVGLVYYLIQIYESPTFQKWFAARRQKRIAKLRRTISEMEIKLQGAISKLDVPEEED